MAAGSLRPHIVRVMSERRERPLSTGEIYEAVARTGVAGFDPRAKRDRNLVNRELSDLAAFAAHALQPSGALLVISGMEQLPEALEQLNTPACIGWPSSTTGTTGQPPGPGPRTGPGCGASHCWSTGSGVSDSRPGMTSLNCRPRSRAPRPAGSGNS